MWIVISSNPLPHPWICTYPLDPYAVIAFSHKSAKSRVVKQSVCPTWDQTLIIKHLQFFGDCESVVKSPPPVVIEFFDEDKYTIVSLLSQLYGSCDVT